MSILTMVLILDGNYRKDQSLLFELFKVLILDGNSRKEQSLLFELVKVFD